MARELEGIEKKFNKYIKVFDNYTTFSVSDFDKNEKVKQMLNYHIEATTKPKEETLNYVVKIIEILETMTLSITAEKYKGKLLHGRFIMEKFSICDITTAISIWDGSYLGQGYNELIYIDTNYIEEKSKDDKNSRAMARSKAKKLKIKNSIEEWHQYCIAINQAKSFIYERYSNWSKLDADTKKEKYKELYILSKQLQKFDNCKIYFSALEDISKNKIPLNKLKNLKAKKLLSLELPNITDIKIARKVATNLIYPYC